MGNMPHQEWAVFDLAKSEASEFDDIHVMPAKDLLPHYVNRECHCDPRLELEANRVLVAHNAFDGRE